MKAPSVDSENHTPVVSSEQEPAGEEFTFTSQEAFEHAAASWPSARLVEIWNQLPGVAPVRKFTNRASALRRIWKAIEDSSAATEPAADTTASLPRRARRAAKSAEAVRAKTKTAKVIALLKRPAGATLLFLATHAWPE